MRLLWWVLALLALATSCAGYNILVLFPMPSKSHANLAAGVAEALIKANHEVTLVTPFPKKNQPSNLHQIDISSTLKLKSTAPLMTMISSGSSVSFIKEFAHNVTEHTLNVDAVKRLIMDKNVKFDAVITEWFFSDMLAGLPAVFECPWVVMSTIGMHSYLEYLVDAVKSPAVQPALMAGFSMPMTLWQRIVNSGIVFGTIYKFSQKWQPEDAVHYEKYFTPVAAARGVLLPPFLTALHDVSALLLNSHPSLGSAQSLPPNAVEVGGYHIDPDTAPAPKDIQELLDNSSQGVVYFSMGSVIQSSDLPDEKIQGLLDVFRGLSQTVLWKFEKQLKNVPKNIHIRAWMPQPSILAHPNLKVFVTHGGLLSTTEAVHYGVPLIGIPVFGDQPANVELAQKKGYALKVDLMGDFKTQLAPALQEMLTNTSYSEAVKRLSRLYHDRPQPPAALLTFWVEHAIRTRGAHHLRSDANMVPLYQVYLLDIMGLALALILGVVFLVKYLLRRVLGGSKKKIKTK